MGDPKKSKKKYSTPRHPWRKERIESEGQLVKDYGFKNKKEIWKISSLLKSFTHQAKKSIIATTQQAECEKKNLIKRLVRLKLINEGGQIDDILSLSLKDLCERRLQTLVCRKGLARSMNQSRQFITHGHICIGDKMVSSPGYLVSSDEEGLLAFASNSKFIDKDHPERVATKKTK